MSALSWFFLMLTVFFGFLVIYPYVIYPLVLKVLPKKPLKDIHSGTITNQSYALVFCAYNEEESLPRKIENIRALKKEYPDLKVYAYSDGSTDKTNEILEEARDVVELVLDSRRLGKVAGMQRLVQLSQEDIIIFTDANVLVAPDSIVRLKEYFSDPGIGCVSGTLVYKEMNSATAKVGGLYWKLEEKIKKLETKTGSTMGADGAIFARRREDYPIIPTNLVDDMAVSLSVLFDNKRCISAPDVIAFENAVQNRYEEFYRKIRIACGAYSTYQYQKKDIQQTSLMNRFKFFSHKVIRWWGALFMMLSSITFLVWGYTIGYGNELLVALVISNIIFWQLGRNGIPIVSNIYEITKSILATGIGVVKSRFGGEYKTWETATTR